MNLFKVGIYIRLSKEDDDKKGFRESESIINQRKLIIEFLRSNNLVITNEYVDDGYSGTSFERPAFLRLLNDIEKGLINMVVTKDLSRLGRDYIKSGYYLEEYFPNKNVRYVSILDNIDTYLDSASNDFAPFKALFNDMVAKDTSKKIKSILRNKKAQGLFLGNSAPFGYKKDPNNHHHLIIDSVTAPIVKYIFELFFKNNSCKKIVNILNEKEIKTPSYYKKGTDGKWSYNSVYNILNNEEYTGCLVQNVWTTISYKNKRRIKRDVQDWIIIRNTHEPIIDELTFSKVKNV